nr:cysteine proteinase 15A-like [Ipomoea batatas]
MACLQVQALFCGLGTQSRLRANRYQSVTSSNNPEVIPNNNNPSLRSSNNQEVEVAKLNATKIIVEAHEKLTGKTERIILEVEPKKPLLTFDVVQCSVPSSNDDIEDVCPTSSASFVRAAEDPLIRQVVSEDDDDSLLNADHHFSLFKSKYGKSYGTQEEHDYRFSVFKANLRRAKRHQLLDPSAVHGVTKFSDLTPKEFRRTFHGVHKSRAKKLKLRLPADANKAPILPTDNLPTDFDWRDHGAVTGCDPEERDACDAGCNGGLMTTAYEYALTAGGLERESDYPYTGIDGTCKFDKNKIVASVANFSVVSLDEDQIAANLVKHGPLSVGINAVFMQTYIGGVSCPYICSKNLDHGVLLVGYGSAGYAPIRLKNKPYWIIKNSWGENWGEDGYYKICRGHDVCGVDSMVSTVTAANTVKH